MYYIAHNNIDVFHPGQLFSDQSLTTGQPNIEYFENNDEFITRLKVLSLDAYYRYVESNANNN